MPAKMIKLECLTNMHVGGGDINYNIIDNEVERDPVTQYPTINSSGVKGAIREYFNVNGIDKDVIDDFFGKDKSGANTSGKLKFLCADMIAIPARASGGDEPYYLVTTEEALDVFYDKYSSLVKEGISKPATEDSSKVGVEGIDISSYRNVFGKKLYVLSDRNFRKIALPVMARNYLENGISKNLWYEEVVPHKSIFCFVVLASESDQTLLDQFCKKVNGKVIQFGGNASIGYGLCKVTVLED